MTTLDVTQQAPVPVVSGLWSQLVLACLQLALINVALSGSRLLRRC